MEKEIFIKELQLLLSEYLQELSSRNIAKLSRETGISESTLRRLSYGQAMPSPSNIYKLLTFLSGENDISAIIKKYPGVIGHYLQVKTSLLNKIQSAKPDLSTLSYEEIIHDFCSHLILKWVNEFPKVTKSDLVKLLGGPGQIQLQELLHDRILEMNPQEELFFVLRESVQSSRQSRKNSLGLLESLFQSSSQKQEDPS